MITRIQTKNKAYEKDYHSLCIDCHFFFSPLHNKFTAPPGIQPSCNGRRRVSACWENRPVDLIDGSFRISVKEYETLSGKKMKLIDKVNFKLKQRELKKSINNDGTFRDKRVEKYFNRLLGLGIFNLGGFLLGLFLSLIGVLIAYLITGEGKKSRITWAWVGAIISAIVWGAVLI